MLLKKIIGGFIFCALFSVQAYGQAPDWQWAKGAEAVQGAATAAGLSVKVDARGSYYITGGFGGSSVIFGEDTLNNPDSIAAFVVKCDSVNNVIWADELVGIGATIGQSVTSDGEGNVYATGVFGAPTLTLGKYTLTNTGSSNVFVVKYDSSGNVVWANCPGGANSGNNGHCVSVDANGNVYIIGDFSSPLIIFGNDTLINNNGSNFFIVKYNSDGDVIWAKCAGGSGNVFGNGVGVDAAGNVYITGAFFSPYISIGDDTLINSNSNSSCVFVAKFDSAGAVTWARNTVGEGSAYSTGLSAETGGNIYVTGGFTGPTTVFGSDTLINLPGGTNVFTTKYDMSGNVIWTNSAGGSGLAYGYGISTDANGNVYITGTFGATVSFENDTFTSTSKNDNIFVAKYNSVGDLVWAKNAGGDGSVTGNGISTDVAGNVYITGDFGGAKITFGNDSLINDYPFDIDFFIAKLGDCSLPVSPVNTTDPTAQKINKDSTTTLTASGAGVLTWYNADTGGIYLGEGSSFVTPELTDTTTFFVEDSSTCGVSSRTAITVIINCTLPSAPTNTTDSVRQRINRGSTTILTANGSGTLSWYNTDTGGLYLGAGSSFVTPILNDTTTFYVQDSSACGVSVRTPITVAVNSSMGIAATNIRANIILYPNPATSVIYFGGVKSGDLINIYDDLGQIVCSTNIRRTDYSVNMAGKAKGVYLYQVSDNTGFLQQGRFIIQ